MRSKQNFISTKNIEQILSILKQVQHGNVTLTLQNFRLIQIERSEKIRPCDLEPLIAKQIKQGSSDLKTVKQGIVEACEKLEYGQIVIVVKDRMIVQIDRTEKQRFPSLIGMNGDGI